MGDHLSDLLGAAHKERRWSTRHSLGVVLARAHKHTSRPRRYQAASCSDVMSCRGAFYRVLFLAATSSVATTSLIHCTVLFSRARKHLFFFFSLLLFWFCFTSCSSLNDCPLSFPSPRAFSPLLAPATHHTHTSRLASMSPNSRQPRRTT